MKKSAGSALVITMDYTMNHEDARARKSSREHHGKRGIVVHGALAKCKNNDKTRECAACHQREMGLKILNLL